MFSGLDPVMVILAGLALEELEAEPARGLTTAENYQAAIYLAVSVMVMVTVVMLWRRGMAKQRDFDAEAAAFEMRTLQEIGGSAGAADVLRRGSGAPGSLGRSSANALSSGVAERSGGATAVAIAPAPSFTSAEENLPPLAYSVMSRLKAGRLVTSCEGPARTSRDDLTTTILALRNGKKIVVIETPLETGDPAVEGLLRFYDGVVVPGPGPDPVFVRRFENLISDMISI